MLATSFRKDYCTIPRVHRRDAFLQRLEIPPWQKSSRLNIDPTAQTVFFQADALGSTDALVDEAGAEEKTYTYSSFGKIESQTGTTDNDFTFVGKSGYQDDSDLGLTLLGDSFYDAIAARFLRPDPARDNEVELYLYAKNNPVNNIDPSGNVLYAASLQALARIPLAKILKWFQDDKLNVTTVRLHSGRYLILPDPNQFETIREKGKNAKTGFNKDYYPALISPTFHVDVVPVPESVSPNKFRTNVVDFYDQVNLNLDVTLRPQVKGLIKAKFPSKLFEAWSLIFGEETARQRSET